MGRLPGSKNKPKDDTLVFKKDNTLLPILFAKKRGRPRKNTNILLPEQQEASIAIDKQIISSKDNQCQFKALCEDNISKHIHNDTCYNPLYCLEKFEGKCNLIVKRIYTNIKIKPERG